MGTSVCPAASPTTFGGHTMNRILQVMALLAALALPALCQNGRLAPEDQRDFDNAYGKWVNDSRRNDRDDIAKDARRMQDIMQRNNIPPDVPYDRIATQPGYNNGGYRDNGYNDNRYSRGDAGYGQTP